jgi:hypothetical protein
LRRLIFVLGECSVEFATQCETVRAVLYFADLWVPAAAGSGEETIDGAITYPEMR